MVSRMSFAADAAGNAISKIAGVGSVPRLPTYWYGLYCFRKIYRREATTIPDLLHVKGFHIDPEGTEARIPFNYDEVSVLNASSYWNPVFFPLIQRDRERTRSFM